MPWHIGMDEAGYGPNLGPFVMSSFAFHTDNPRPNLWRTLSACFCKPGDETEGRVIVGDSKQVFSQSTGLGQLERSVLACLDKVPPVLADLLERLCPSHDAELTAEPWYRGEWDLPTEACADEVAGLAKNVRDASQSKNVRFGEVHTALVATRRFNDLTNRHGTKSAVLSEAMADLLRRNFSLVEEDDVFVKVDKHGGRNRYTAMLQDAVPDGLVRPLEETSLRSEYAVEGLRNRLRIVFEPRADGEHFGVALASMVSKYVRELLMEEFNAFWVGHLPDLKRTAGYPGDAERFVTAIAPVLARLQIDRSAIWRCR